MGLTLEGLRYAQAVVETKSFSAAARAYGVTQPALSNGIARLEEQLGERLFDRTPRGVTQTAFGARILPLIERALTELDGITAEARRLTAPGSRSIHVGVSPLISPQLVARVFTAVCELPSPRDLVLREANMGDLRDGLLAGELDVILIPAVEPLPRFKHEIIDSEPVVVVDATPVPSNAVELGETAGEQFILVPDSCGLTRFTKQLFGSHDLPLRTYPGEASSYGVLEQWASLGLGSAILPRSKLTSPDAHHRALLADGQAVWIVYEAVWHPDSAMAADLALLARSLANTEVSHTDSL
jgi:DNA-binding transcriptional LysR family regulator